MFAAFIQTPIRVANRLLPMATWGPSLVIFAGWMIYPALDNGFKHSILPSVFPDPDAKLE